MVGTRGGGEAVPVRHGVPPGCHHEPMSDPTTPGGEPDLALLVPEWLDWAEAGDRLGVSVSKVRQMIKDHQLAAAVPSPGAGQRIPAEMLLDGLVVPGLPGLLTVLHDNGFDDREAIAWVFSDADLPGRPIDALRENRGSEVRRRAQALL